MGYKKDAFKGIAWITLLRVSTRIFTFARLAILGRLLTPIQFGLFGIASLILSLLEILTETGINVFLVQEKAHIKEYINSAWIVSISRGIIISASIIILTPFITTFFNAPSANSIILLTSLVPLIRGFINPAIIIYQKDLLFNKEFKLRFLLFFADITISIIMAYYTRSAISFVYGLIASAVLEVILSYNQFPIRPKLKLELDKIKIIFHKGKWITLTGIFSYLADNGDNFAVGKIINMASLGIYQVAYKFSALPISEITNVVNQVVFPVYSKFSTDKERLLKAFLKVTILSSASAIILGGLIYIFTEPLILIIMGKQWTSAIPVIRILSIYSILRTIFGNFAPLFLAVGKQNYVAQMTSLRMLGLAIAVIPLVTLYSMTGAAYAMLISMLFEIPALLYFLLKIFKKIHYSNYYPS